MKSFVPATRALLRALVAVVLVTVGLTVAPTAALADSLELPPGCSGGLDPGLDTLTIQCDLTVDGQAVTVDIGCKATISYHVVGSKVVIDQRLQNCRVLVGVPLLGVTIDIRCSGSGPAGLVVDLAKLSVGVPPSGGNCRADVITPLGTVVSLDSQGGSASLDIDLDQTRVTISSAGAVALTVLGVRYSCNGPIKVVIDPASPTVTVPQGCVPA